jgi:hypothetical protein
MPVPGEEAPGQPPLPAGEDLRRLRVARRVADGNHCPDLIPWGEAPPPSDLHSLAFGLELHDRRIGGMVSRFGHEFQPHDASDGPAAAPVRVGDAQHLGHAGNRE